ncbi:hypothetical protein AB0K12_28050 [Nonomuraea sp. NPDC049419]|uniref:hypothetical protein n=1 Tax=Nonomuraea sp. NPDC049419 TaxID=3155772 RepID=UPI00341ABA25
MFVAAGAAVKRVEGTRGRHLLSWPWAGSPGPFDPRRTPYQSVKNVETGETRRAPGPGSAVAYPPGRVLVHDVTTRTAVVVKGVDTSTRYGAAPGDDLVVFRRGDKYVIVNLAAVK